MSRENCRKDGVFNFVNIEMAIDVCQAEGALAETGHAVPDANYVFTYDTDRSVNKLFESMSIKAQLKERALNSLIDRANWPVNAVHILAKFFGKNGLTNCIEGNYEMMRLAMWASLVNKVSSKTCETAKYKLF